MKIYLDTSIYGGYYDAEFKDDTVALFDAINQLEITVLYSEIVTEELNNTRGALRTRLDKSFGITKKKRRIEFDDTAKILSYEYITYGVVSAKSLEDAQHIAIAVLNKADYIVSWNFTHMVDRTKLYQQVNRLLNLRQVDILSPDIFLTQAIKWQK